MDLRETGVLQRKFVSGFYLIQMTFPERQNFFEEVGLNCEVCTIPELKRYIEKAKHHTSSCNFLSCAICDRFSIKIILNIE